MSKENLVSLDELKTAIEADFAAIQAKEEKKEKIECIIFFVCFLIGGAMMVAKVLVDLAPWIVAFPSGRVIFFRYLGMD